MKLRLKTLINGVTILCGITIGALSVVLVEAAEKTPRVIVAPVTVVAPSAPAQDAVPRNNDPVIVTQSGPVSFEIPMAVWLAWLVTIATAISAVVVIWKFAIRAATFVADIANFLPVLRDIAKEFKNDAGSTLKDAVDRLEKAAAKAQFTAELAQKTADNLAVVLKERISKR